MLKNLDAKARREIQDKGVLITGAAGTIGEALAERLLKFKPRVLRLLDHNEEEVFYLGRKYKGNKAVRVLLGDIRDKDRMMRAVHNIDVIYHAAALKHVGIGEYNPFEVVKSNLIALQGMIECAIDENVPKFIFTSSDKAVNPTNVMGGSKFVGERLVTAGNAMRGRSSTVLCSTRFGNVLGSSGSVVPVFRKQVEAGGPVTVTRGDMTRFFMTTDEAVDLLLSATCATLGGEVFVPKMHAFRLSDLAECMIEIFSKGKKVKSIEVGLQAGEKHYEELISEHETARCIETRQLLIVMPYLHDFTFTAAGRDMVKLSAKQYPDNPRPVSGGYSSRDARPMPKAEVKKMLLKELEKGRV